MPERGHVSNIDVAGGPGGIRGMGQRFYSRCFGVFALASSLACLAAFPGPGQAQTSPCRATVSGTMNSSPSALRFGIYPGGAAGSVSAKSAPLPEDPQRRLSALRQLAGATPFVVHVYTGFSGDREADDGTMRWLDGEIAGYTAAGLLVELVTRYEPRGGETSANIAGFAEHVRGLVHRYGTDPGFVALQVGNESNLSGAAAASDGAYAGALKAVVRGVIAAKDAVQRSGHTQVRVGFNWAYDERASASHEFFQGLAEAGGPAFAAAVDWVGLDAYPGTWAPRLTSDETLPGKAGEAVVTAAQTLRACLMPIAGLSGAVPIHVAENGFPTGPGRSTAMQSDVLAAMVRAIDGSRGRLNVTDYRWFDLRDSVSDDGNFESQYGITRDDYTPKPAFWVFQSLVAELSVPRGDPPDGSTSPQAPADVRSPGSSTAYGASTACQASPVKVKVPSWRGRRVARTVVHAGGRIVKRVNGGSATFRVTLAAGVQRLSVRQVAAAGRKGQGRATTRTTRQTVTVCRPAKRRNAASRAGAWRSLASPAMAQYS